MIVNGRPAGIIKCLLLSRWIETMARRAKIRLRRDYIAGSANSRSLPCRYRRVDIGGRTLVIRDAPRGPVASARSS